MLNERTWSSYVEFFLSQKKKIQKIMQTSYKTNARTSALLINCFMFSLVFADFFRYLFLFRMSK